MHKAIYLEFISLVAIRCQYFKYQKRMHLKFSLISDWFEILSFFVKLEVLTAVIMKINISRQVMYVIVSLQTFRKKSKDYT
jgi:hypothetical protein